VQIFSDGDVFTNTSGVAGDPEVGHVWLPSIGAKSPVHSLSGHNDFRQDDLLFLMYRWALDLFHYVDR
jgi:hypothetical protein